jgi:hypothetical protein
VLHRRRRCTGPPFAPGAAPSWLPSAFRLPPKALVLVCVGAAADGVLSDAWYGFAVSPRHTSSGHAINVCATGAVASCAPRWCWCALGQNRTGLAVWVAGPRGCGAAKAAGSAPFLAAARRLAGGGREYYRKNLPGRTKSSGWATHVPF